MKEIIEESHRKALQQTRRFKGRSKRFHGRRLRKKG
jgi:hypothetical protein